MDFWLTAGAPVGASLQDYITLSDFLANIVNNVAYAGGVTAAILFGLWYAMSHYWPGNGWQPSEGIQVGASAIGSFVVVLAFYGLRLYLHEDFYSPERLFAVLQTAFYAIVGSETVRRSVGKFLDMWATRQAAKPAQPA